MVLRDQALVQLRRELWEEEGEGAQSEALRELKAYATQQRSASWWIDRRMDITRKIFSRCSRLNSQSGTGLKCFKVRPRPAGNRDA